MASDPAGEYATLIYEPLDTALQDWITSPLGSAVDNDINQLFGADLIGDGAAGTAADPTGGAGGELFGYADPAALMMPAGRRG